MSRESIRRHACRALGIGCVLLLILGAAPLTGCVQDAGAVTFEINPVKKVFRASERVEIEATFVARQGPVCLGSSAVFKIEVRSREMDSKELRGTDRVYRCGTSALMWLPLVPVLVSAALLDLADVGGRFHVMHKGDQRSHRISIVLSKTPDGRRLEVGTDDSSLWSERSLWTPGTHVVTVTSVGHDVVGLAPLFWKPYSHPLQAETQIEIVSDH